MDIEVLTRYAGARLLKVGKVHTPSIIQTLPLHFPLPFAFEEDADILLPKPFPHTPMDISADPKTNTLFISPETSSALNTPSTDIVYLSGAEGTYRSQSAFTKLMVETREALREDQIVFLPGLALPHRYALYTLLGVDLFDSTPILEATRDKIYLTSEGGMPLTSVKEKKDESLLEHNTLTALEELTKVRQAIRVGELRLLAESRAVYDPWAASVLRILDRDHYEYMEKNTPVIGGRLPASSTTSLDWPEVRRYVERFKEVYERPPVADVLLLLPCSATKPYSLSRGHRNIHEVIWDASMAVRVHEVIVTSPTGIIPRELETFYPNMQYDTAVTGDWNQEERARISSLLEKIKEQSYEHVLIHLPESYLNAVDIEGTITCKGRIDSHESLRELRHALQDIGGAQRNKAAAKERLRQDMISRLIFQFGPAGKHLAEGAEIRGRYPDQKILVNNTQLGMLTKEKGRISLTIDGGRILAKHGVKIVEIEDFKPKGDIFAVGVTDADDSIRLGDDVVVVHEGDVRAVGVASMTPKGMRESKKGVAVKTRSRA